MSSQQVVALGLLVLVAIAGTGTVGAAQSPDETATLSHLNATVAVGSPTTVTANYTFTGVDGIDQFNGTLWRFEGVRLARFRARIDGEPVEPRIDDQARLLSVGVPAPTTDDQVRVRLEYRVASRSERAVVPLWVPTHATSGTDQPVSIRLTLPPAQQIQAVRFPTASRLSTDPGSMLIRAGHVPGFVTAEYGPADTDAVHGSPLGAVVPVTVFAATCLMALWQGRRSGWGR